jgi:long-chain acyl-CoA synthetase
MFSVPRLFEAIRTKVLRGLKDQSPFKQKLFHKTLALGTKRYEQGGKLGLIDGILDAVLDRLVRSKIKARFGGRLKAFVAGGAALQYEVGLFFEALGLPLLQGYGQTEAAPVIVVNRLGKVKLHTVGPALKGVDLKIAADGEILVRGELLMQGYWGNADATRQTVSRDRWLQTGDIGVLDDDGYLEITDRRKYIIVNAGGDNISPARVEGITLLQEEIGQIMVYGDKKPNLVAVILPDPEWFAAWKKEEGVSGKIADLQNDNKLHKALSRATSQANQGLSNTEKVRKFIVGDEEFTTDNELMTPSMKVRRHLVREVYRDRLEALYKKPGAKT